MFEDEMLPLLGAGITNAMSMGGGTNAVAN